jgi:hypothetical protein
MTHTEALKMARETLAEVTDILDMALMIGLPTLPPGADGPAVKARAAIAALDALQSAQPATHTEALRALLSAVDMLTYPGEDQPQDPEPWGAWGDWNNGNGDLCGPAMAAAIARARKALAQPSAPSVCNEGLDALLLKAERQEAAARRVVEAFEALGRTKDTAGLLQARAHCENAMTALKDVLGPSV